MPQKPVVRSPLVEEGCSTIIDSDGAGVDIGLRRFLSPYPQIAIPNPSGALERSLLISTGLRIGCSNAVSGQSPWNLRAPTGFHSCRFCKTAEWRHSWIKPNTSRTFPGEERMCPIASGYNTSIRSVCYERHSAPLRMSVQSDRCCAIETAWSRWPHAMYITYRRRWIK